jgi:molybdate transport system permease protein
VNPFWLTLSVALTATVLTLPAGIGVAWILERSRVPGRGLLHAVVLLPLVLPPVVTGMLLLWVFSPRGWLGGVLETVGLPVAFHWLGGVVAAGVVGFPLLVMNVNLALRAVDPRLETVSRSLGRSPWSTFFRVTLPLAWPGILSGAVLSFARGLGEFGATIVIAGRIPKETETISLAIYAALDQPGGEARAWTLVAASIAICLACVAVSRALDKRYRARLELPT